MNSFQKRTAFQIACVSILLASLSSPLAWWVARQMGLTTRTDPAVLAAPERRV